MSPSCPVQTALSQARVRLPEAPLVEGLPNGKKGKDLSEAEVKKLGKTRQQEVFTKK